MTKYTQLFIFIVALNRAAAQTIENITTTPMTIQDSTFDAKWKNLLPMLQMIKSTSSIEKERLLNVVTIIKFLLSDERDKNQCDKILEGIKETNELTTSIPDIDSIVDERFKSIEEVMNGKKYESYIAVKNDVLQNETEDFSKILDKIAAALDKVKESNEDQFKQNPSSFIGMFRTANNRCNSNVNPPLFENLGQSPKSQPNHSERNSMTLETTFNIPCQRAADILKETSSFPIPQGAYCSLPKKFNLDSILKDTKLYSDSPPFQVVPNSVSCVDSDDSLAVLFQPKKIAMMQVYDNLLRKITITVLVPYHISKLL